MPVYPIVPLIPSSFLSGVKQQEVQSGDPSFSQVLAQALNKVNAAQVKADETTKQFLAGNIQDIHQVMIAAQEAKITLQLAVEVQNKIIEAYREISRMPV
ncbi:MAG TPA: flagellar hook-basal body complex protein FliE [Desulfotomaculum sp.]|jgi:flagellar hook-basal body complex protein FliE|nr:flagellar hook-basal body complex protein FliE [Desulfotomaculum sp.]